MTIAQKAVTDVKAATNVVRMEVATRIVKEATTAKAATSVKVDMPVVKAVIRIAKAVMATTTNPHISEERMAKVVTRTVSAATRAVKVDIKTVKAVIVHAPKTTIHMPSTA